MVVTLVPCPPALFCPLPFLFPCGPFGPMAARSHPDLAARLTAKPQHPVGRRSWETNKGAWIAHAFRRRHPSGIEALLLPAGQHLPTLPPIVEPIVGADRSDTMLLPRWMETLIRAQGPLVHLAHTTGLMKALHDRSGAVMVVASLPAPATAMRVAFGRARCGAWFARLLLPHRAVRATGCHARQLRTCFATSVLAVIQGAVGAAGGPEPVLATLSAPADAVPEAVDGLGLIGSSQC